MNSTQKSETLPSKRENDKNRSFPEHTRFENCICILTVEKVVSVSRVTEETPDEDTIVVSKRRVF